MKKVNTVVRKMNRLGAARVPFFFMFDFKNATPICLTDDELEHSSVLFEMEPNQPTSAPEDFFFEKTPIAMADYLPKFQQVQAEINFGNSFLLNLTQATPVKTNLSLREIYEYSLAKFKLLWKDRFVVFSPERFVQIVDNQIFTHPMKGTIDAAIPGAAAIILADEKEQAEHYTIVDLLRNDLSQIAQNVRVQRFRYLTELSTERGGLLQVSSEIVGDLPENWQEEVGSLMLKLLPAGSVTGAPKRKTVEIITAVEGYERGFYTGVFGRFDGENLDSAVMIRFIEKTPQGLIFKSGGGITAKSEAQKEYQELIDKVYVPIIRDHQN